MAEVVEVQKLFIKNYIPLRGFVLGLVHDQNVADDLMQEAFLAITERATDYRPGTNFAAWGRAVARVRVFEHLREKRRLPAGWDPGVLDLLAESAPPPKSSEARTAALRECLGKLAPRARQVLDLRYVRGLLPAAIAAQVSWRPGAVNVALSRARGFLRECVRRALGRKARP